jgi:hypothetical protein
MMPCFTGEFVIDNVKYVFRFNKINTPEGLKYFVDAVGEPDSKYLFVMEKKDREWRIVNAPKLPDPIFDIESKLSTVIKNNNDQ